MTTCLDDSLVGKSCSTISGVTVRPLICHRDDRGWLMELFRCDELSDANRPKFAAELLGRLAFLFGLFLEARQKLVGNVADDHAAHDRLL